ncbi:MAG: polysaccharide deacetylase [Clostridia bacterium]|nr:polysaccharide deacetylase [Clostridia bacterium]
MRHIYVESYSKRKSVKIPVVLSLLLAFILSNIYMKDIKSLYISITAGAEEKDGQNPDDSGKLAKEDKKQGKTQETHPSETGIMSFAVIPNTRTLFKGKPVSRNPSQNIHVVKPEKVAYLTFDDGPSKKITPQILDILQEFDIKATFFVLGDQCECYPEILREINIRGHFICNHTYTHDYKWLYSNPQNLIQDLRRCDKVIQSIIGDEYTSKIIRFPGGSYGNKLKSFREAVIREGYDYMDWNVLNGDAEARKVPAEKQISRIIKTSKDKKELVILMHDSSGKEETVKALPEIIKHLKSQGYGFKTLEGYDRFESWYKQ